MANPKFKKNKKEKRNPIVWFLFAIIIPLIVAVTLTIIIFSILGINVVDWAKKTGNNIPVISSLVPSEEAGNDEQKEAKTAASMAKKDKEIEQLKEETSNLKATIDQLEQDTVKLENKYKSEQNAKDEGEAEEDQEKDTVKTVSASFKKMDKKQAALIFQSLDKEVAIVILKELSNDVRGNILEAMEPSLAAELTQQLVNDD